MFLKERQNAIAAQVAEQGRVTVADLASRFEVSEDCIRKDLKTLSDAGLCQRVYGGAIRAAEAQDHRVDHRLDVRLDEKRRIAEQAYGLIQDGETIFLDVSTTNIELARLIAAGSKRCCVVSNMLDLLRILMENPQVKAIGTGGVVNQDLNGFVGPQALAALEPLRFDCSFLGALAIETRTGAVLTFDAEDAAIKTAVLQRTRSPYLVADVQKLDAPGNYRFAGVCDFDAVIMDQAPEQACTLMAELGGRVLQ